MIPNFIFMYNVYFYSMNRTWGLSFFRKKKVNAQHPKMFCSQLHPECKSSCCAFHPDCKNFIVPRSRHDSETELVFDETEAWSSNSIIRRWAGAAEGIWAGGWSLYQCRWCLPAWLAPHCVLPPLMMLQLHQPARNTLLSAEHRLWAARGRVKIQTNRGSPRYVGVYFTKLSLIIIYVISSHFPELVLTGQSGEGQRPDHFCKLNCHVKMHQKKNGNLWT